MATTDYLWDGVNSEYLRGAFQKTNFKRVIDIFSQALENNIFGDFDAIAVRGTSGLLFGPTLSYLNDKRLAIVRKKESSHSTCDIEGHIKFNRYIIVDDFVSSGDTIEIIRKNIIEVNPEAELVGVFLWSAHDYFNTKQSMISRNMLWKYVKFVKVIPDSNAPYIEE